MMKLRTQKTGIKTALLLLLVLCGCKRQKTLFVSLPSAQTNIHFSNEVHDSGSLSILDYLYFYNGGGVAIGDFNNDGLPDIYFTGNKKASNKLYFNQGKLQFKDVTAQAGVAGTADWTTGVTLTDINGDGWLDIYVCVVAQNLNFKGHNQLFINNKNGTFTERAKEFGLDFSGYSTQAAFFDYDHDGYLDCYLLNQSMHSVETYGNTQMRQKHNELAGDKLYHNDHGHFTEVTAKAGIYSSALGYGLGLAVGDLNNDGWDDIYVGNDFHENDYEYINNHDGTFTESGAKHFKHYSRFSMGNDMADFNNDGQLDVFTADMLPGDESVLKTYGGDEQADIYKYKIKANGFQDQYSRNCLQKNLGNGQAFSDVALMDGVHATDWSWSPLLADFDNDGIKDLFVANGIVRRPADLDYIKYISGDEMQRGLNSGRAFDSQALEKMPSGKVHSYLFQGSASEKFTDKSSSWGMDEPAFSNGCAYADLDNDGDLDLVVNHINQEASVYENTTQHTTFLSLKFKGEGANIFGIGTKAYIFNGQKKQYEQLMLTRGFQSAVEPRLHFGLGGQQKADSILIVWPDQRYQILRNVKANREITLNQKDAKGTFNYAAFFPPKPALFEDITQKINLKWQHRENTFFDFNEQYLIPHMLSTAGPKLAVADVNGDGLDDFYTCGAKNQAGSLFIQTRDGHFTASKQPAFAADSLSESVDAVFIDVNGDHRPDLYVVSGGNEEANGSASLSDRLYLNNGKGGFKRSNQLPPILQNKAAVCVADVNHDGFTDIFVAGAPDAKGYGKTPESYLLMNDGKGNFKKAAIPIALKKAGQITCAVFTDINLDGWPDLVIAGEWMPVEVFINQKGTFQLQQNGLQNSNGWWHSLQVADVDGDGRPDIIAGNYGLNSKLKAQPGAPVKLYLTDVDKNGTIDQIMTYQQNGKEYTFLGKEELEKQLPGIRKKFLLYHDFAGKTVQEIFGDALQNAAVLQANTFSSGVFYQGKNGFQFKAFPSSAQVAPLFALLADDVNDDGKKDILAAGNFYGVLPYEGRYDADFGNVLINAGNRNFQTSSPINNGFLLRGEVRDIKKIKTRNGFIYAVARNNEGIEFFSLKK